MKELIKDIEKSLDIISYKSIINNDLLAESLVKGWDKVLRQNIYPRNKEFLISKASIYKDNYFNLAIRYAPEFEFNSSSKESRLFSKVNASYSLAININTIESNNIIDIQTMLGYIGLTKLFYTYRFLENFINYLLLIEDNEREIGENIIKYYGESNLVTEFYDKLNNDNDLKTLFEILKKKKNSSGENIFTYIDKKQSNLERTYKHGYEGYKGKLNIKVYLLINDLRNLFVHSSLSASSGSGNPLVMFILTTQLSEKILNYANIIFKNKILIEKYKYNI